MKIPSPRYPILLAAYLDEFDKQLKNPYGADANCQNALREFGFAFWHLRAEIQKAKPVIKKLQLGEQLTVEEEEIKIKLLNFLALLEFEYTDSETNKTIDPSANERKASEEPSSE